MQEMPEVVPLLILEGRTILFREFSKKAIAEMSKNFRKRNFEKIYLLDIDGVERNKPQLDIVQSLSDDFTIFYDAGPRKGTNVVDLVVAGADKVYMGTYSLKSLSEIQNALTYSENVGLKVDWKDGIQGYGEQIEGASLEEIVRESIGYGVKDIVVPVELIVPASAAIGGNDVTLRAIADRPEDEWSKDSRISTLFVPVDTLPEEKPE